MITTLFDAILIFTVGLFVGGLNRAAKRKPAERIEVGQESGTRSAELMQISPCLRMSARHYANKYRN